jgi:hypothetical protein
MSTDHFFPADSFGLRIIERRVFVSKDAISAEKLLLLAKLLTLFPAIRHPLYREAGAKMSFSVMDYADGYLFTGRLIQSECSGLSYLFRDPYAEGIKALDETFAQGFRDNEQLFASAKDALLSEGLRDRREAKLSLESSLGFYGSHPQANLTLLPELSMLDERQTLKLIQESRKGNYLFFGKKPKKNPFLRLVPYPEEATLLPQSQAQSSLMLTSREFADEALAYLFSAPAIQKTEDQVALETSLRALSLCVERYYLEKFALTVKTSFRIVAKDKVLFTLAFEPNRLSLLGGRLPFPLNTALPFSIEDNLKEALEEEELFRLALESDPLLALARYESALDLSLPTDSFFSFPSADLSAVKRLYSSLVPLSVTSAQEEKENLL